MDARKGASRMIISRAMQKEIDRLKRNTDTLPLTDQEKSIIKWIGDQDIWTIEAINGIIEKAKQNK
jgi:hypothetical protein